MFCQLDIINKMLFIKFWKYKLFQYVLPFSPDENLSDWLKVKLNPPPLRVSAHAWRHMNLGTLVPSCQTFTTLIALLKRSLSLTTHQHTSRTSRWEINNAHFLEFSTFFLSLLERKGKPHLHWNINSRTWEERSKERDFHISSHWGMQRLFRLKRERCLLLVTARAMIRNWRCF